MRLNSGPGLPSPTGAPSRLVTGKYAARGECQPDLVGAAQLGFGNARTLAAADAQAIRELRRPRRGSCPGRM